MLAALIVIVVYAAFGVYLYQRHQQRESDDEPHGYDASQFQLEVKQLNDDMERLHELDELMIDLRLCSPEDMQRSFRMEWQSLSGKNHKFDFWADGENLSTDYLMGLAQSERDELNAMIARRINALYYRANAFDAVGKTLAKRREEGSGYDLHE